MGEYLNIYFDYGSLVVLWGLSPVRRLPFGNFSGFRCGHARAGQCALERAHWVHSYWLDERSFFLLVMNLARESVESKVME